MGNKQKTESRELAFILYMSGDTQKNICERVHVTPATCQRWVEEGKWKEKRAATEITKSSLVNKILQAISNALDKHTEDKDYSNEAFAGLADKLVKLSAAIERLEKKNTIVNDVETFMSFHNFLKQQSTGDTEITLEFIKKVNSYQDAYLKNRINHV